MRVTEIATYRLRTAAGSELAGRLRAALETLRSHPDCQHVTAYQSIGDRDVFALLVRWDSAVGHQRWRESSERQRYRAQMADLLAEPPAFADYELIEDL